MMPVIICFVISQNKNKNFKQKEFKQKAVTNSMLAAQCCPRGQHCVFVNVT